MEINLISDTITRPSQEMLKAMMHAKVGDDVYKFDPSVNELEQKVANLFGMEAALFFPTGTMANQTAIKLHTSPGEQLICEKNAHIYNFEAGGPSLISGISCKTIEGVYGILTADQIEASINPVNDFYHSPKTSLVCLENTSNMGGGTCYNLSEIIKINKVCSGHQLKLHLDGARLWNALIAKQESPSQYGKLFDTISVCLSKGLGCPVGSVLLGTVKAIEKAKYIRKALGGGMRQAGYLAAAGTYALDFHFERLSEDHKKAKEIETVLKGLSFIKEVHPVKTNIVIFHLYDEWNHYDFVNKLKQLGVYITCFKNRMLRLVTHLDYTENQHDQFLKILLNF